MEREEVLRDDFPTARKGWSPEAVTAHLEEVAAALARAAAAADSAPAPAPSAPRETLADVAAERVHGVLAAAEEVATEIEAEAQTSADHLLEDARRESDAMLSEARQESDGLLSVARAESERLLEDARADAGGRVERAREAVEGLISQASELRNRVGMLGEELSESLSSSSAAPPRQPVSEVPGPVIVPEPTPPTIPEPSPDPVPEPTPDPVPEPTPEPTPDPVPPGPAPTPDLPDAPEPEPPAPEPAPMPPSAAAGSSTDDLIAQLRGSGPTEADNGSSSAPAVSGSDLGAARLVAMNMALEGSSRDEIGTQIETEFGAVPDLDALLDEVLARAGR